MPTKEMVNVKDFGAIGDGVTDDTQAIKAAIATGKQIYMPPGSYFYNGSIWWITSHQY